MSWIAEIFEAVFRRSKAVVTPAPTSTPDDQAVEAAADLAIKFEGFSATPYPDPATGGEPWTIGFGSTNDENGKPITKGHPPIDEATGRRWMIEDMRMVMFNLHREVRIPLTSNEMAAIDDFIYNVGNANFANSTLCRLLNLGDLAGAAKEFEKWDHANGKVMAGLLRRRLAEEAEFGAPEA